MKEQQEDRSDSVTPYVCFTIVYVVGIVAITILIGWALWLHQEQAVIEGFKIISCFGAGAYMESWRNRIRKNHDSDD